MFFYKWSWNLIIFNIYLVMYLLKIVKVLEVRENKEEILDLISSCMGVS